MKLNKKIIFIIISFVLILIWQYFGSANNTVRLFISSPSLILQYFQEHLYELLLATGITLYESIIGLAIATIVSLGIMIICFYKPNFMNWIFPFMVTSQVIPLIVLAPFFVILFGIGLISKIAMAALICFFPIFVNFAQGYKSISTNIHELMLIHNASKTFKIWKVYFPLSMPSIIAGFKISANLAVIGAIVAEFSGAEMGLGKNLFVSSLRLEPELMMSSLVLSSFIGLSLFLLIKYYETKLIRWQ
ncbi:MAG: ABC transporter permease [Ignavibacteriaceae bacterium]